MMSVMKSGPSNTAKDLSALFFFGFPAENKIKSIVTIFQRKILAILQFGKNVMSPVLILTLRKQNLTKTFQLCHRATPAQNLDFAKNKNYDK